MKERERVFISDIKQHGLLQICIMDVGAKDRLEHIPLLDPLTHMIAFEPQPGEALLLREKYAHHSFRSLQIREEALADKKGETLLNVTSHSSMSSLLKEDISNYERFFGRNKSFSRWREGITAAEQINVKLETIDSICDSEHIGFIDYLKIDTQGAELKILEGAVQTLREHRIGVIKAEVAFVSTYHEQPLFSDIDIWMKKAGYVLVDCVFHAHPYVSSTSKKPAAEENFFHSPNADAVYVLSPDILIRRSEHALAAALVLASMGYISLAYALLKERGVDDATVQKWLGIIKARSVKSRLKHFLKNHLPPSLLYYAGKIISSR